MSILSPSFWSGDFFGRCRICGRMPGTLHKLKILQTQLVSCMKNKVLKICFQHSQLHQGSQWWWNRSDLCSLQYGWLSLAQAQSLRMGQQSFLESAPSGDCWCDDNESQACRCQQDPQEQVWSLQLFQLNQLQVFSQHIQAWSHQIERFVFPGSDPALGQLKKDKFLDCNHFIAL